MTEITNNHFMFSWRILDKHRPVQVVRAVFIFIPILFFIIILHHHYPVHPVKQLAGLYSRIIGTAISATVNPLDYHPEISAPRKIAIETTTFIPIKDYRPSNNQITLTQTLRGSHQLYVYAAREKIQFEFDKIDLNRYEGPETLTARIAKVKKMGEQPKHWQKTVKVKDDNITIAKGPHGRPQHVVLSLPAGQPGVYLIDIITSDDVLISGISSRQHNLAFNGWVFFAAGPAYFRAPFSTIYLSTNSSTLSFSANHYPGRQKIKVNETVYAMKDVRVDQIITGLPGATKIKVPRGDAIISGNGMLAVAPSLLIPVANSSQKRNTSISSLDFSGVTKVGETR